MRGWFVRASRWRNTCLLSAVSFGVTLFAWPAVGAAQQARTEGTDLSIRTTDARGRVGDTVSIRVTITNHGPNIEPEWAMTGVETQEGTQFVSGTGCRLDGEGRRNCPSPGPLLVGRSYTVTLRYKIVRTVAHPDWMFATFGFYSAANLLGGTDDMDQLFTIYIEAEPVKPTTRAPAPKPRTSPTAATKRPPAAHVSAAPAVSPVPAAQRSPLTTDPTVAPKPEPPAITNAAKAGRSRPGWIVVAAVAALLGAFVAVGVRRLRTGATGRANSTTR
jgi:hypothetical protein